MYRINRVVTSVLAILTALAWLVTVVLPSLNIYVAMMNTDTWTPLCVSLTAATCVGWVLVSRDNAPAGETRCRRCGYILRGLSTPRCPECGETI